ncbi:hypothetical protein [Paraburkholderia dilworthii]|uniref:hypothetical protein n=1 Tax=Paraburkholderia dilworthii TaxID=948106 RepID=UPI0003FB411A|nr:hypothetical protein [Paraburkholderia dilworthii]
MLAINHFLRSTVVLLAQALMLDTRGGLGWLDMLQVIGDSFAASPLVNCELEALRFRRADIEAAVSKRQSRQQCRRVTTIRDHRGMARYIAC